MITNQKGVTLTEAVVTMIILGVLAGGLLTILHLNATETSEGIADARVQMQYENFVDELSRDVRRAAYVLDAGEAFDDAAGLPANNLSRNILIYTQTGTIIAGYRINAGNILEERDSASGNYSPYMTGNKAIEVHASSHFRLPGGRQGVEARIHAKYNYKAASDSLMANINFVRCRNAD